MHTSPMEGQWKFQGGGGVPKQKVFKKKSVELNWNFWRGRGRVKYGFFWNHTIKDIVKGYGGGLVQMVGESEIFGKTGQTKVLATCLELQDMVQNVVKKKL